MAFWMFALGALAAVQVGTTIAGGIVAEKNAEKGIEHSKKITYLNAVSDVISSQAEAPRAIPQFH